ncbi:MAG: outer membrane lipoprotein carrier protein LolA [Gammaproteobacteria bacterium]|nr:outer membrane lipoprotein carrier protein LolA [Gammaproteobacteria bacterium]
MPFRALSFVFLLLVMGSAEAEAGAGRHALDRFLDGLVTLQAKFEQSVLDTENATSGKMYGLFLLQRPGHFRWDYVAPRKQVILADGRDVWFIEEELKQVTRHLQKWALKGSPVAFMTTESSVDKDFEIVEIGERQGLQWLELIPRDPESDLDRVLLAFDGAQLQRMELRDKFGQISRLTFSDVQRNQPIDPNLFVYQGEDDWDVLNVDR